MKRRPAAFLLLFVLVGSFLGVACSGPWWIGCFIAVLLSVIAPGLPIVGICSVLGFALCLSAWHGSFLKHSHESIVQSIPTGSLVYHGIVHDVHVKESADKLLIANVKPMENSSDIWFRVKIKLEDAASAIMVKPGQEITFQGVVNPFFQALSPVDFNGAMYALAKGLHGHITLRDITTFHAGKIFSSHYFSSMRLWMRERILNTVSPVDASLLLALIIGDTNLMSSDQRETYQLIGAQHLLAVSGLQVTLLSFLCFAIVAPLISLLLGSYVYRAQTLSALITIALGFWFIGLSDFSVSSVRAWLMTACLLLPTIIPRTIDAYDALFASGIFVVLLNPLVIYDAGFWLSYAAVFGLLIAHSYTQSFGVKISTYSLFMSGIFSAAITSMAAFLATLPILITWFGSFAPLGMIANLLLVPFASLMQVFAIVGGLLGCLLDWPFLINHASLCANFIEIMAEFLAQIFGETAYWSVRWSSLLMVIVSSASIGWLLVKKNFIWSGVVGVLTVFLLMLPMGEKKLHVTVMSVGQGDATLFTTPLNKHILLDAGGQAYGSFDPGISIVVPRLKQMGVKNLEILIISHPDPDHILGAFAVIDNFKIKEIWHSGFTKEHPLTKRLIVEAHRKGIILKTTPELLKTHEIDEVSFTVLAPDTKGAEQYFPNWSSNDNSLVVLISYANKKLLWPGDIEKQGEKYLLQSNVNLTVDVIKAPHHGSKTSSSSDLVIATKPSHVIYSTGRDNRYHFPHDDVVARWRDAGAIDWNTAVDGEINILVSKNDFTIKGFLRKQKPAQS